ncbi:hypothetical protein T439DRAFT_357244 [Meredithblackwellia eburnea MCA 4105]
MIVLLNFASLLAFLVPYATAHMTIFTPSMYGVSADRTSAYVPETNPVNPLGPGWTTQDSWWFRGPAARALAPPAGQVTSLPAGGTVTFDIACHIAFTNMSIYPSTITVPGSTLDACPSTINAGAYHSNLDPNAIVIDDSLISGCALAIADVDDINKVTMDNLVIFSVQSQCVKQKVTSFDIPKMMPSCTGKKCICGWFWLANSGQGNYYMTAFDCAVTGASAAAVPISLPPSDPTYCAAGNTSCTLTTGPKRPIYTYNSPSNVPFIGNWARAGYHPTWSFNDGAQDDIFAPASGGTSVAQAAVSVTPASSAVVAASTSKTTSKVKDLKRGIE